MHDTSASSGEDEGWEHGKIVQNPKRGRIGGSGKNDVRYVKKSNTPRRRTIGFSVSCRLISIPVLFLRDLRRSLRTVFDSLEGRFREIAVSFSGVIGRANASQGRKNKKLAFPRSLIYIAGT